MAYLSSAFQAGLIKGKFQGERMLEKEAQATKGLEIKEKAIEGQLDIAQQNVDIKKTKVEGMLEIAKADLGIRLSNHQMKKMQFSWAAEDRFALKKKQEGMLKASEAGGYAGVIDYLKGVDPMSAIKVHAAKLQLDKSMMTNKVMQATSATNTAKAMEEGHMVLGRLGLALTKLPIEKRQEAYDAQLKMVKTVWPGATGDLEQDTPALMIAGAQSTQAHKYKHMNDGKQSLVDSILDNRKVLEVAKPGSPEHTKASMELQQNEAAYNKKLLDGAKLDMQQRKSNEQSVSHHNKQVKNMSGTYQIWEKQQSILTPLVEHYEELKKQGAPTTTTANSIASNLAKFMAGAGAMSDPEFARTAQASGTLGTLKKWYAQYMQNEHVLVDENEIGQIVSIYKSMDEYQQNRQGTIEANYKKSNSEIPSSIMGKVQFPLQNRLAGEKRAGLMKQYPVLGQIKDPTVQTQALEAIEFYGNDQEKIEANVLRPIMDQIKNQGNK